jgi:Ca-activated chloride channel family protein
MVRRTLLGAVAALLISLPAMADEVPGQGQLRVIQDGKVGAETPLKHSSVKAEISGFLARVTVTQLFKNDSADKIEAVYVFPLPENSAVDDMMLKVGDRTIRGLIQERDEARKIYDAAVQAGHVAALLDQERPNIFTQSVANITPGAEVRVTISYVQLLKYRATSRASRWGAKEVVGPLTRPACLMRPASRLRWPQRARAPVMTSRSK